MLPVKPLSSRNKTAEIKQLEIKQLEIKQTANPAADRLG
jgi:hypothetical protein